MNIDEYFDNVQEYVKSNIQNPEELDSIIKEMEKDNLQAVVNQDFNSNISIEECGDKILKSAEIKGGVDVTEPDKLDGERSENTMERKVLNFTDFINEAFLKIPKEISFPTKISRKYLPIIKVENNVVYLGDSIETIEITKDGKILSHIRNDHNMLQRYYADNITKKELSKIRKL